MNKITPLLQFIVFFGLANFFPIFCFVLPAKAGQYQHCYPVQKNRTVEDAGYHPNAYDNGYREGAESSRKQEPYQPRTAAGEFSRGFDDGYYGRPYTGQKNTVPNRKETYETSQCRTYYYNDKDPINKILDNVLDDFQRDLRRDWNQ
jgi:hypothetical protein